MQSIRRLNALGVAAPCWVLASCTSARWKSASRPPVKTAPRSMPPKAGKKQQPTTKSSQWPTVRQATSTSASLRADNAAEEGADDDEVGEEEHQSIDGIVERSMDEAEASKKLSVDEYDDDVANADDEASSSSVHLGVFSTKSNDVADTSTTGDDDDGMSASGSSAAEEPFGGEQEGGEQQSKHLVVLFPMLAKQYAASNTTPVGDVLTDSGKVVQWSCDECAHTWRQGVFLRCILKSPCPSCDAARNPPLPASSSSALVKEWDTTRNDPFVDPNTLPITSPYSAYWICSVCRTSFEAKVRSRVQGKSSCPTCSVTTLQSSSASNDVIRLEWHPVKNGDLRLEQVPPTIKVWWLCASCGHEWEASVAQRLRLRRAASCSHCHPRVATAVK